MKKLKNKKNKSNKDILEEILLTLKKIEENTNPDWFVKKISTPTFKDPLCQCPNGPYWSVVPPYCPVHMFPNEFTIDKTEIK